MTLNFKIKLSSISEYLMYYSLNIQKLSLKLGLDYDKMFPS